ncbi:hypothetical protein NQ317_002197 [Molorchus minor]|uniref:Odorant receptor n=1 Tax=Molorchus minor TaxID=1323400 RepID=A0ABQ9JPW3_9CUCU|nr:hypothetical protein NQ317_002197 [Molorchus minor]
MLVISLKSVQFLGRMTYLLAMVYQISMYCWYGHDLMESSNQITEACYLSDWNNCSLKVKKSLIIMMERAKVIVTVKAGNIFTLNLPTLVTEFDLHQVFSFEKIQLLAGGFYPSNNKKLDIFNTLSRLSSIMVAKKLKTFPVPGWFPFNPHNYYFQVYLFEFLSIVSCAWFNSALDCLLVIMMVLSKAQFEVLKYRLINITRCVNKLDHRLVERRLRKCVFHYADVVRSVSRIDIFISMYCWYGHDLMESSNKITEACYMSDWNNCSLKVKKSLIIMMERAKVMVTVKAGNIFTLNLPTLVTPSAAMVDIHPPYVLRQVKLPPPSTRRVADVRHNACPTLQLSINLKNVAVLQDKVTEVWKSIFVHAQQVQPAIDTSGSGYATTSGDAPIIKSPNSKNRSQILSPYLNL